MLEKGFPVPTLLHPVLPPSVSWFPLPPGWLALGALLLTALVIYLFFRLARWRRNRWRREALAAFALPNPVDDWMALIKQIQLVHQPRNVVSHRLTPESLLDELPLEKDLQQILCQKYCQRDNRLESEQASRLREQLSRWLKELPDV
ncbi:DUF4381 family protein [Klebsiella aerogenes]|uniref:DUF4381 family protein n=1 Tax=Klebsiella aerogenes TaxID=548 RepID=A0AAP9U820_KLEAE|nr:DUF4381 family protein [Klebsiella aerogenes]QMR43086.1 DUF4381 family protein [Klebsiella aerogenes]